MRLGSTLSKTMSSGGSPAATIYPVIYLGNDASFKRLPLDIAAIHAARKPPAGGLSDELLSTSFPDI